VKREARSGVSRTLLWGVAVQVTVAAAGGELGFAQEQRSQWSTQSAKLIEPGRVEVGVLSQARWGVSERVELGAHPLWFFVLPHVEGKLSLASYGAWSLSSSHRLSYPTPFLDLVSTDGPGGLLPQTTDVPHALLMDTALLLSVEWRPEQLLTAEFGLQVASHRDDSLPLLDFPFLYQRFAALWAPGVPRFGLIAEGRALGWLGYRAELRYYDLNTSDIVIAPDDWNGGWALEAAGALHLQLGTNGRISCGLRWARADYPIGQRSHWLPLVDYRYAF